MCGTRNHSLRKEAIFYTTESTGDPCDLFLGYQFSKAVICFIQGDLVKLSLQSSVTCILLEMGSSWFPRGQAQCLGPKVMLSLVAVVVAFPIRMKRILKVQVLSLS